MVECGIDAARTKERFGEWWCARGEEGVEKGQRIRDSEVSIVVGVAGIETTRRGSSDEEEIEKEECVE